MVVLPSSHLRLSLQLVEADAQEKQQKEAYWRKTQESFEALISAALAERPRDLSAFVGRWLQNAGNRALLDDRPKGDAGELELAIRLFEEMDVDGSGTIDRFELERVLVKGKMHGEDVTKLFQRFDTSADGFISYKEFLCWLWPDATDRAPVTREPTSSKTLRQRMLQVILKSKDPSVKFTRLIDQFEQGDLSLDMSKEEGAKRLAPAPSWRAATWNAAAEVTKLEFLPMPDSFTDMLERLAGATILRLRGVHTWRSGNTRWERYAPGAPEMPPEEALGSLVNLSVSGLLEAFDVKRLAERWSRWSGQNPGGAESIRQHLDAWRDESLATVFKVALGVRTDADIDPLDRNVPGLAVNYQSILSRPDLWFSKRTYHLRGDSWLAFLQDAANAAFSMADFWAKWVDGLADVYKPKPDRPIEFRPSEPDVDYIAIAIWDSFLFHVARQAASLHGAKHDADFWRGLSSSVDIPLDRLLGKAQSTIDAAIVKEKVDFIFLQEGGRLTAPAGWSVLPKAGAATSVWVRTALVDEALTRTANEALSKLKNTFVDCIDTCEGIEEKMFAAGTQAMMKCSLEELAKLKLSEQLDYTCRQMITNWLEFLEGDLLSGNKSSPSKDQMKRITKWFSDEKVAVAVIHLDGAPLLLVSAHGESSGTTCCSTFMLAHAIRGEIQELVEQKIRVVIGMDSNVKEGNTGAAADPKDLIHAAKCLDFRLPQSKSFTYAGSDETADHTVMKTRGFLQAQLKGKAGFPDRNHKDYIFYLPTPDSGGKEDGEPLLKGKVVNAFSPSGEASFCCGEMPRGLDFTSDHAMVIVSATKS